MANEVAAADWPPSLLLEAAVGATMHEPMPCGLSCATRPNDEGVEKYERCYMKRNCTCTERRNDPALCARRRWVESTSTPTPQLLIVNNATPPHPLSFLSSFSFYLLTSLNHTSQPPLTPPWTSFTAFTSAAQPPPASVPVSSLPLNPCHHHHLLVHLLLSPPPTLRSMTPPISPAHSISARSDLTRLPRHPPPGVGRSIIAPPRSCATSLIIRVSLL